MSKELIIDVGNSEIDIALLENNILVELSKEKSNIQFAVGDIYLGKVRKIMPGLNAAFIDVGYEKDAFLHYHDLGPQFRTLHNFLESVLRRPKHISMQKFKKVKDIDKNGKISDVLKVGQRVLVQVAKEPISTKGPRLTSEISIAGRNIVLMPFHDKVSISQKIESNEEKNRLRTLLQSIKPNNYGIIVRTVAEGRMVKTLDEELRNLVKKWESAFERLKGGRPPQLMISELNRTSAILRDMLNVSFNSIHVNDETIWREIKDYISTIAPEKERIVTLYKGKSHIFEKFGITKQIKGAFGKTVSFKSGSYLIIEHTEALHVIDVNSGNRSKSIADQETNALEVNLAASEEIARQLRLRDMGGIIVIDFIDMHQATNRQKVYEHMREIMARDRTKHNILPLSKFCLMQITRQRVRPEENIETAESCPTCKGSGKIVPTILFADELNGKVKYVLKDLNKKKLNVKVHPYIAAYLTKGFKSLRNQWFFKYLRWVNIEGNSSYSYLEYHFFDENMEEIIL